MEQPLKTIMDDNISGTNLKWCDKQV